MNVTERESKPKTVANDKKSRPLSYRGINRLIFSAWLNGRSIAAAFALHREKVEGEEEQEQK